MDPINIIVAINLFVSMSSNLSAAKKGMKAKLSNVISKPNSYLQKVPPNISAIILILVILSIFNIGTLTEEIKTEFLTWRILGLSIFIIFSWVQIFSFKTLGQFYSQDVLIFKNHELIEIGIYRYVRHPQYVSQILSDLGAGIALMGYIIIPLVIFIEIPLFILRAKLEEKILSEYFKDSFTEYKQKSGFIFPFTG